MDGHGIDNLYIGVEVGGNAEEKLDKIDKALESIEDGVNDVEKAFENFANVSKIDVLRQKMSNVEKDLDKAASKGKGLENKSVLNNLTKRFSLNDKLAKEEAKVAQVTAEVEAEWASVLEKVSTEEGRLALKIEQATKAALEQRAQFKLTDEQFSSRAEKVFKMQTRLNELRMAAKQDALEALEWQIPDTSMNEKQRANLEIITSTAEGASNSFDKMGASIQEAETNLSSFSIDRLLTDEGKLDKLQGELVETTAKLRDLLNSGGKYSSKDVDGLVNQIHRLEREIDKTKQKIEASKVDLMGFATPIEQGANKAAVSIDYLMSKQGKLDYLQNELAQAYTQLTELTQGGAGYENKDVRKLLSQIESLDKQIKKLENDGDNAFKKIDKSTKKAHNSSKNYNKGLRGLLGTAKRFLVFGTFFTIQRQISQAFQEGTQNLYQYSKAIDGNFAKSMDRLATSFLYLKNAIGAAVAPIINAVTPALESLIDTVADFGNKLAETFAALTGATTFKKAIKSHKEYAEAVNATNNALAKFDEINNITTSKGKEEQNFGSMFEVADVGQGINIDGEKFERISSIFEKLKRIWGELTETLDNLLPVLDILLWDWAAPLIDIGLGWLANVWDGLNKVLKAFSDWCVANPEIVKTMANILLAFFIGIETYLTIKKIGTKIANFALNLVDFIKKADAAKLAASGLAIAGFAILATEIVRVSENWKKMSGMEKVVSVLGLIAIGAAAAAAAVGALQSAWSLGIAAAAIVAGVVAIEASISSAQKRAEKNAKIEGIKGYATGGFVASGEMFIARENGIPEMVGSIGGRTAVANNDQIVDAVSIGVYNAVVDAMSRTNNGGDTIVQIDGREVFRAVRTQNNDFVRRTGASAF